jgi:hypothetical protein
MRLVLFMAVAVLVWAAAPAFAQNAQIRPMCLHGADESAAEAGRREEALAAVRVITQVLSRPSFSRTPYPSWEELADSPAVLQLRGLRGRDGDVARRLQWGAGEPLPGWTIHYLAAAAGYAVSLTDSRDSCAFTYHTNESGLIVAGIAIQGRPGIVPLETSD